MNQIVQTEQNIVPWSDTKSANSADKMLKTLTNILITFDISLPHAAGQFFIRWAQIEASVIFPKKSNNFALF